MNHWIGRLLAGSLALVALSLSPSRAEPAAPLPPLSRLQPYLDELQRSDLLHAAWAVQRGEEAPLVGALGEARAGLAAGPDTAYRIGSVSKTFTAVLALQLVEQGRLRLDQPVADFFPGAAQLDGVTVEHLLRHRAGLSDVKDAPDFERWARQPRRMDELQALVLGLPRQFPAGSRAAYSNTGYLLLHWVVERAGQAPYAQQLRERIAAPLGLVHTRLALPAQENSDSRHWDGHTWQPVSATDPSVPLGAGALVSTPAELVRFGQALFAHRLLRPETLARMTTVQDGFGLGLYPLPAGAAEPSWGHEGVIDGYRATWLVQPGTGTALAVLANAERLPRDALRDELLRWAQQGAEAGYAPTDLRPQAQRWTVVLDPRGQPQPAGSRWALRGSLRPLRWDRGLPLTPQPDGRWTAELAWTGRAGLPLEAKFVLEDAQGQVLRWERTDNRRWAVGAPPGPMRFDVNAAQEALEAAVLAADARLSRALNERDLAAMADVFSQQLEFFHDRGGRSSHADNLAQFRQNFARTEGRNSRNLQTEGLQIHPVPGVGAMQIGRHRFCFHPADGAAAQCQDLGFSHVWAQEPDGVWRLLRVLSYGH
jgi:CubicO group peptidase (beta-lactamase class C family)